MPTAGLSGALLHEPGVIQDQHRARISELVHDVIAHVVAQPIDVSVPPAQKPLHPVRRALTNVFGQCPAVLALQPRDQPGHVPAHPHPWFRQPNARHPVMQPHSEREAGGGNEGEPRSTTTTVIIAETAERPLQQLGRKHPYVSCCPGCTACLRTRRDGLLGAMAIWLARSWPRSRW